MGVGGNATAEWRASLSEALPGCTIDDDGTPLAFYTARAAHVRPRIPRAHPAHPTPRPQARRSRRTTLRTPPSPSPSGATRRRAGRRSSARCATPPPPTPTTSRRARAARRGSTGGAAPRSAATARARCSGRWRARGSRWRWWRRRARAAAARARCAANGATGACAEIRRSCQVLFTATRGRLHGYTVKCRHSVSSVCRARARSPPAPPSRTLPDGESLLRVAAGALPVARLAEILRRGAARSALRAGTGGRAGRGTRRGPGSNPADTIQR